MFTKQSDWPGSVHVPHTSAGMTSVYHLLGIRCHKCGPGTMHGATMFHWHPGTCKVSVLHRLSIAQVSCSRGEACQDELNRGLISLCLFAEVRDRIYIMLFDR